MMKSLFKTFYKSANLLIVFQLSFAPLAMANQDGVSREENNWTSTADFMATLASVAQTGTSAYLAAKRQTPSQNMCNQIQERLNLQPIDSRQAPRVFDGCMILPARGNSVSSALQCSNVDQGQIMSGYGDCMIQAAENNINELKNFQTKGHERYTTQGVGCYDQKILDFETMLTTREEELTKYQNNLEEIYKTLLENTDQAFENVKKTEAILGGGPGAAEYLKDEEFSDIFLGASDGGICGSILSKENFNTSGTTGGLREIGKNLASIVDDSSGSGKNRRLSAAELLDNRGRNQKQIAKEIRSIASRLAKKVKNSSNAITTKGLDIATRSKLVSSGSKAMENAMKIADEKVQEELTELKRKNNIAIVADPSDQSLEGKEISLIMNKITSGDYTKRSLDNALRDYEDDRKKACLNNLISSNTGGDASKLARMFKHPNISKKRSEEADNGLANKIVKAFQENKNIDDIKKDIQKAQNSSRLYSRYVMKPGKSFSIGDQNFSASTSLRAADFFGMLVDNCHSQYGVAVKDGFSYADIKDNVKAYGTAYMQARTSAANTLRDTITDELLTCSSDGATGVTAMSCDPKAGALDLNNDNFCLRTAVKCASNMTACAEKAATEIKTVKTEQDKNIKFYNQEVDLFKKTLKKEFAAIEKFMETQARSLDAQLNIGSVFNVALNNDSDDKNSGKDIFQGDEFPKNIKMQDPKAYLDQVKKKIADLRKQAEEQRLTQIPKLKAISAEYAANYGAEQRNWEEIIGQCTARNNQVDQAIADQEKLLADNQSTIDSACMEAMAYNQGGDVDVDALRSDLTKAIGLATAVPGVAQMSASDRAQIAKIKKVSCDTNQSDSGSSIANSLKNSGSVSITQICAPNSSQLSKFDDDTKRQISRYCENKEAKKCSEIVGLKTETQVMAGIPTTEGETPDIRTDAVNKAARVYQINNSCYFMGSPNSIEDQLEEDSEESREILLDLASTLACDKERSRLGQVKVSVCDNAGLIGVNSKGINAGGGDIARDLATALGQSAAISQ